MKTTCSLLALAGFFSTALAAASQGFNYGSAFTSGANKQQADFEAEFKAAQGLIGAPGNGFTSARLYTTIQGGTTNSPISAIPAAIATKTRLLLGLWASAGDAVFENEIQALVNAIATYNESLPALIDGISVGSEDLYRVSPTGIENGENPGAGPDIIIKYIEQVRNAISGTVLSAAPVGHVDTWTAWVNGSNGAVASACDWVGVDAYPYFQTTMANSIASSAELFNSALRQTKAAVGGKPVWVTETGFPVSGKTSNLAVPGLSNAKTYWDEVGCPLFGNVNTWWYTLQDIEPGTPNPSFGIVGSDLHGGPLFNLSCNNVVSSSSSSSSVSSSTTSVSSAASSAASSAVSSSEGSSITGVPTSLGGGSPGAGGPGSSQISLETSSLSNTPGKPTGSIVSVAPTSGSESGSNTTATGTSTPKPSASSVTSGAGATLGPMGVAAAVLVGAAFAL